MLHIIQSLADPLIRLISDDPVRPEIPPEFRVNAQAEIFVLRDDLTHQSQAVVCAAYRSLVPRDLAELAEIPVDLPHVAVFYTIWSYQPGAGRRLITEARSWISDNRTGITEFVTLSPQTEMARIFHLKNGAAVGRVNADTVNYRYT
jgi:hypothetical protein